VARLVRQFHDLTAGTALAGHHEAVCHNDLSPKNTVYRDLEAGWRPVAFIDWDLAAPGARLHDVAYDPRNLFRVNHNLPPDPRPAGHARSRSGTGERAGGRQPSW
jgi:Ser/Thr protein kinase RdoA (MazF antagonist)